MKNQEINNSNQAHHDFFIEVVALIESHKIVAIQSVQSIANQLYWNTGELILQKQRKLGWGKAIVEQLSLDLNAQLGSAISWSPRNLWFMRQIVSEYTEQSRMVSSDSILNQADSELEETKQHDSELSINHIRQLVSQVPWRHNILILQKVKDLDARLFYLQTCIKNRYSRAVLLHQIKADAYKNYLQNPTQHNFENALPQHILEQAQESIKSVYTLDFLDVN